MSFARFWTNISPEIRIMQGGKAKGKSKDKPNKGGGKGGGGWAGRGGKGGWGQGGEIGPSDEFWSYVRLLISADGADDATTFVDKSIWRNTITPIGNSKMDTSFKKFGDSSLQLDGAGDYLNCGHTIGFDMAADDFCIDFWVRGGVSEHTGGVWLGKHDTQGDNNLQWQVAYNSTDNRVTLNTSTDGTAVSSAWFDLDTDGVTLSQFFDGNWHHVAALRQSGTTKVYVDGKLGGSTWVGGGASLMAAPNIDLVIGGRRNGGGYTATIPASHMDEIRVTVGVPRYTAAFTPPNAPQGGDVIGTWIHGPDPLWDDVLFMVDWKEMAKRASPGDTVYDETGRHQFLIPSNATLSESTGLTLLDGSPINIPDHDDWYCGNVGGNTHFCIESHADLTINGQSFGQLNWSNKPNSGIWMVKLSDTNYQCGWFVGSQDYPSGKLAHIPGGMHMCMNSQGTWCWMYLDGVKEGGDNTNIEGCNNSTRPCMINSGTFTMHRWTRHMRYLDEFNLTHDLVYGKGLPE